METGGSYNSDKSSKKKGSLLHFLLHNKLNFYRWELEAFSSGQTFPVSAWAVACGLK